MNRKRKQIIRTGIFLILLLLSFWFGKNGNLTPSTVTRNNSSLSRVVCSREKPYSLEPEFERAISLIRQRVGVGRKKNGESWSNCFHVQYADLENLFGEKTEGLFYFDETSTLDNLKIYVDNSYKEKDDLLTALLLIHESSHAMDFVEFKKTGVKKSCVQSEVDAFYLQNAFLTFLNEEEQNSIIARIYGFRRGLYKPGTRAYQTMSYLHELWKIAADSTGYCAQRYNIDSDEWVTCEKEREKKLIEEMVINSPYYQKQCNLNRN